jgi:DNA-binding NtrC family response regulator
MTSPPGKRILVVDDDRSLLRLIDYWLKIGGHEVDVCDSFEQAKQRLVLSPPDVLLTDVRLGAFNGLQLVILAKELRPETVAVVMSAYDDFTLRREASQCGASYLQKPFSGEAILNSVSNTQTPPSAPVAT